MGDAAATVDSRRLRRLTRDSSGVATVNIRASQILVFWSSHLTLIPVEQGWYLHAASVAGRQSTEDGERRLDAAFDLNGQEVRWQHAKVSRLGGADLFLDKDRRYMFYITQEEASREELLASHLPWPVRLRGPQAKEEPAVLAFLAWPLDVDHHWDLGDSTPKDKTFDPSLMSFDSWEHDSIAGAPTGLDRSVQIMVDMWAFRGLIGGGAMVDTRGSFEDWNFWCPYDLPGATPMNPYALPQPLGGAMDGVWHYIIPEKDMAGTQAERPWTSSALKSAVKFGRAAVLTVGQMIMLAGDCYDNPGQMTTDTDRWTNSTNIMRVYWEAKQWLDGQKKLPDTATGYDRWQGYQHRFGVVYLVFELLMSDPKNMGTGTIDEMEAVGKGWADADNYIPQKPPRSYSNPPGTIHKTAMEERQERGLSYAFGRLEDRARKVDTMVEFLRQARGPSRFSEMMLLAQTLGMEAHGAPGGKGWVKKTPEFDRGLTFAWMQSRLPWLTHTNPKGDLAAAGFTKDEIHYFETKGISDQLMQFVITNGAYADLALNNNPHFSEDGLNFRTFEQYHRKALDLVNRQCGTSDAVHPLPGQALFHTAFGCHFLTDGFSASHLRVPRKRVGPLSAKLMHDIDGLVGLWVYNDDFWNPGKKHIWYAYGDTYLHALSQNEKQQKFLPVKPYGGTMAEDNFFHAANAVGSAFKQLHYEAQALRQSDPKSSPRTMPSTTLQSILDANGPGFGPGGRMGEEREFKYVVTNDPPPQDPTKARYLRLEVLSPGAAGPLYISLWDRLRMSADDRIAFIKTLLPTPLPVGPSPPPTYPQAPSSIAQPVNIPRLFSTNGDLISGDGNPYDIVTAAHDHWYGKAARSILSWYGGFSLRVTWGPFKDFWDDDKELKIEFDDLCFMTKFFKDVPGLEALMDPTLLQVYNNLPKDKL